MNSKKLSLILLAGFLLGVGFYCVIRSQKSRAYDAIIFDMDGTIIDTDHLWKQASFCILDSHAPHLSPADKDALINEYKHCSIYEVWNCVHKNCSKQISMDELIEENIRHLHQIYTTQGIEFIPKFHEFHQLVLDHNVKIAIATSSQKDTVAVIVDTVPLTDYFKEHIYHVDHVNRAYKPKPDVYLYAAKQLGVAPEKCIAIEDSASGIASAKAAGMYCIGINTGKNRDQLRKADEIVDCYSEIDLHTLLFV